MLALFLLSGCLIDTDRYERRRAEILAQADEDDSGSDCVRVRVWVDADGDGFGNADYPDERCAPFDGWVEDATDCDDGDAAVNPDAAEVCATPADDDCDGTANEDGPDGVAVYADTDGDGFGDPAVSATACAVGEGWTEDATDCADGDAGVHPGAEEVCGTGVDEDCDAGTSCRLEGEVSVGEADVVWEGLVLTDARSLPSRLGDLSGDGRDDFAIGSAAGLHVFGYPGPGTWGSTAGELARVAPEDAALHYRNAAAGDYDGDGVPDLATAAFDEEMTRSSVYVFLRGVSGEVAATDADVIWQGYGARARGVSLTTVADMNRDGLDELLVSDLAIDGDATSSVMLTQPGASTELDSLLSIQTAAGTAIGGSAASEDMNGDGVPDLLLAEFTLERASGRLLVFHGPLSGGGVTTDDASVIVTGEPADLLGAHLVFEPALDADGDGTRDLLVGTPGTSTAHLFLHPADGTHTLSEADGTYAGSDGSAMGVHLAAGDLDGDGRDDIVLSALAPGISEAVVGFYGPATGGRDTGTADLRVPSASGAFTARSPGSLDGDAYDDLLVTDPGNERMHLFLGGGP